MNDTKKIHRPKKARTLRPQGRPGVRSVALISVIVLVAIGAALVLVTTTDMSKAFRSRASGRIVDASRPCKKETLLDERGVPKPEGTIRRLDAISKSFQRSGN
jgi:hypothetical protein